MTAPDAPTPEPPALATDEVIDLTDAGPMDGSSGTDLPASWKHLTRHGLEGVDYDTPDEPDEAELLDGHREWLTDELTKLGPPKDHSVPLPTVGAESMIATVTNLMDDA